MRWKSDQVHFNSVTMETMVEECNNVKSMCIPTEREGGRDTQTGTEVHVHRRTETDIHTDVHTTHFPHTHTHVRIRSLLLVHGLETHTSDVAGIAWLAEWVARHGFSSTILPAMLAHAETGLDPALSFSHQTYRQGQRETHTDRHTHTNSHTTTCPDAHETPSHTLTEKPNMFEEHTLLGPLVVRRTTCPSPPRANPSLPRRKHRPT